jgi:hypothetical protein
LVKTVGIAYCGGCKAAYDRPEFVRSLFAAVRAEGGELRAAQAGEACDMALIMAGCRTACVTERSDLLPCARVRHVIGYGELDALAMPMEEIQYRIKAELLRKNFFRGLAVRPGKPALPGAKLPCFKFPQHIKGDYCMEFKRGEPPL